jgi:2'-5' RNA ligase
VSLPLTALVVPLPALEPVVGSWRSRYDASVTGVPAHVTVLVPWIPPDELTNADLDAIGKLAKSWDAFEVTFAEFRAFTSSVGPKVHWLSPEPADPFLQITDDLSIVWPEYPPYGGAHGPEPVAHLTVSSAAADDELDEMFEAVSAQLPITTTATELSVLEVRDGSCRTRASFRLGGKKR